MAQSLNIQPTSERATKTIVSSRNLSRRFGESLGLVAGIGIAKALNSLFLAFGIDIPNEGLRDVLRNRRGRLARSARRPARRAAGSGV